MPNLELWQPTSGSLSNLSRGTERALSRALANVQAGTAVQIARIDAAAQRHEAVADGVTAVTSRALQHVAMVSQAEQQLAQTVPHASGRLAALADAHALAMQATVIDAARALGRLA